MSVPRLWSCGGDRPGVPRIQLDRSRLGACRDRGRPKLVFDFAAAECSHRPLHRGLRGTCPAAARQQETTMATAFPKLYLARHGDTACLEVLKNIPTGKPPVVLV